MSKPIDPKQMASQAKDKIVPQKASAVPATWEAMNSDEIHRLLSAYKLQVVQILGNQALAEKFLQVATTVIAKTPTIKKCSIQSVIGGVIQSTMADLDLNPVFGECFLVPRWNKKSGLNEATFLIGYKGFIKLMRNNDQVSNVEAHVVYEKDLQPPFCFEYELGDNPHIKHRPALGDRGKKIAAYAIVTLKDGQKLREVMGSEDIEAIKQKSDAATGEYKEYSPWNSDPGSEGMMWRKTVVRRISNYVPLTEKAQIAVAGDDATLTPDLFTPGGGLDSVALEQQRRISSAKPAEIMPDTPPEPEQPKAKEEPKQEPLPVPQKQEPLEPSGVMPQNVFFPRIQNIKAAFQKANRQKDFVNILGRCGFETIDEVAPDARKTVLKEFAEFMMGLPAVFSIEKETDDLQEGQVSDNKKHYYFPKEGAK